MQFQVSIVNLFEMNRQKQQQTNKWSSHDPVQDQSSDPSCTATSEQPKRPLPEDYRPTTLDILCGRGRYTNHHGNLNFTKAVHANAQRYAEATKRFDKSMVVASVIDALRDTGARFVKKDRTSNRYYELTNDQVHEKTGHAIRDRLKTREPSSNPKKQSAAILRQKFQPAGCDFNYDTRGTSRRTATTNQEEGSELPAGLSTSNVARLPTSLLSADKIISYTLDMPCEIFSLDHQQQEGEGKVDNPRLNANRANQAVSGNNLNVFAKEKEQLSKLLDSDNHQQQSTAGREQMPESPLCSFNHEGPTTTRSLTTNQHERSTLPALPVIANAERPISPSKLVDRILTPDLDLLNPPFSLNRSQEQGQQAWAHTRGFLDPLSDQMIFADHFDVFEEHHHRHHHHYHPLHLEQEQREQATYRQQQIMDTFSPIPLSTEQAVLESPPAAEDLVRVFEFLSKDSSPENY
jgi:hypothetical protein